MTTPIATVNEINIYLATADLPATEQEDGNLAVTIAPPALNIWFTATGWVPLAAAETAALAGRVAWLEGRLGCNRRVPHRRLTCER